MVREGPPGGMRGEALAALQQELCTSYSAIVGLETQIQAVQRRQHLIKMDDKENCRPGGGKNLQMLLSTMLTMLADEQMHAKSLEQRLSSFPKKLEIPGDTCARAPGMFTTGAQQTPQTTIAGAGSPKLTSPYMPTARTAAVGTGASPVPQATPRADGARGTRGDRVEGDSNPCLSHSSESPHAATASGRRVASHEVRVPVRLSQDMHGRQAVLCDDTSSEAVRGQVQCLNLSLTLALEYPHATTSAVPADLDGRAQLVDVECQPKCQQQDLTQECGEDDVMKATEEDGVAQISEDPTTQEMREWGHEDGRSKTEDAKVVHSPEEDKEPCARKKECRKGTTVVKLGAKEKERTGHSWRSLASVVTWVSHSHSTSWPSVAGRQRSAKKQWWADMADRHLALKYAQLSRAGCDDESSSQGEEARKDEEISLGPTHHSDDGIRGADVDLDAAEVSDSRGVLEANWVQEEKRVGWKEGENMGGTVEGKEHKGAGCDEDKHANDTSMRVGTHKVDGERDSHLQISPMQEGNVAIEIAELEKKEVAAAVSSRAESESKVFHGTTAACYNAGEAFRGEGAVQQGHVQDGRDASLTQDAARAASLLTAWLLAPSALASESAASAAAAAATLSLPSPPASPSVGEGAPASTHTPSQSAVSERTTTRSPQPADVAVAESQESARTTCGADLVSGGKTSDNLPEGDRACTPAIAPELGTEKRTSCSVQGGSHTHIYTHIHVASPTSSNTAQQEGIREGKSVPGSEGCSKRNSRGNRRKGPNGGPETREAIEAVMSQMPSHKARQEEGSAGEAAMSRQGSKQSIAYSKRSSDSGQANSYSQDLGSESFESPGSTSEAAWEKETHEMPVVLRVYRDPRILQDDQALPHMHVRGCLRVLSEGNEALSLTVSVDDAFHVRKLLEMHQWSLSSVSNSLHVGSSFVSQGNMRLKEENATKHVAEAIVSEEDWLVQPHLDACIHQWLLELDLAHCVETFMEQRVSDCAILAECSHSQLENMGVLRLGDRCKLLTRAKKLTAPTQAGVGKQERADPERGSMSEGESSHGLQASGLDEKDRKVGKEVAAGSGQAWKASVNPLALKLVSAGFQLGEHQERIDDLELERNLLRDELSDVLRQQTEGGGEIGLAMTTDNGVRGEQRAYVHQEGDEMELVDLGGNGEEDSASSRHGSIISGEVASRVSEASDQRCDYERRLRGISCILKKEEAEVSVTASWAPDHVQHGDGTMEQLKIKDVREEDREKVADEDANKDQGRGEAEMKTAVEDGEVTDGEDEHKDKHRETGVARRAGQGESEDASSPPQKKLSQKHPICLRAQCQTLQEAGTRNEDGPGVAASSTAASPPRRMPPMSPRDLHRQMRHHSASATDCRLGTVVETDCKVVKGRDLRYSLPPTGQVDQGRFETDWEGAPKCKCTVM